MGGKALHWWRSCSRLKEDARAPKGPLAARAMKAFAIAAQALLLLLLAGLSGSVDIEVLRQRRELCGAEVWWAGFGRGGALRLALAASSSSCPS